MWCEGDEVALKEYLTQDMREGFTGAIGILRCGQGPTVGLRFDIDALGMQEWPENTHRPTREGFASVNPGMTMLKAELFDMEIRTVSEPDTSALGAAMTAMVGAGVFSDYEEACREAVHYTQSIYPTGVCRECLLERFGLYRRVYESLREEFHYFSRMEERKV